MECFVHLVVTLPVEGRYSNQDMSGVLFCSVLSMPQYTPSLAKLGPKTIRRHESIESVDACAESDQKSLL